MAKHAQIGFSEKTKTIELVLPSGMKTAELGKVAPKLIGDLVARLPRGCQSCISGFSFNIREQLEHVVNVDLDKMEIIK
jgi:hypothetical protein